MSKHTPGPWRWEVNLKHQKVELCGGKPQYDKTVMAFARWGMRGAAPEFIHDDGDYPKLTRCDDLTEIVAGREHHKDWFRNIDNADARLIAAAPCLLEALGSLLNCVDGVHDPDWLDRVKREARAAIAKARG